MGERMTWHAIFDATTGALREVTCSDLEAIDLTGATTLELDDLPDGSMVAWDVTSRTFKPTAAPKWTALRAERDRRLTACDWTQMADQSDARRASWQPYRQALRDLPGHTADPNTPDWPDPPE